MAERDNAYATFNVKKTVAILLCSSKTLSPSPILFRMLEACVNKFGHHHVFVLEYDKRQSGGAAPLQNRTRELLDDRDFHAVNYIFKYTRDVREALKGVCTVQLKKYSHILVVNIDSQTGESWTSAQDSHISSSIQQDEDMPSSSSCKRKFPASLLCVPVISGGANKRHCHDPPNVNSSLQGAHQHASKDYVYVWRRTALLLLLRSELRCCPYWFSFRHSNAHWTNVLTPVDAPLDSMVNNEDAPVTTLSPLLSSAAAQHNHDVCRIPLTYLFEDST